MWWKPKKGRIDRDLRPLTKDRHALQLAKYAENKKEEVEIYVDHLVDYAKVIELVEGVNEGANEESSNGGVNERNEEGDNVGGQMKKGTMLLLMLVGQMKKGTMLLLRLVGQIKKMGVLIL